MKPFKFSTVRHSNKCGNEETRSSQQPANHNNNNSLANSNFDTSSNNNNANNINYSFETSSNHKITNNFAAIDSSMNINLNHLLKPSVKRNIRWRLSFYKLHQDFNITKNEIITIRNALCVKSPVVFLAGTQTAKPYDEWQKLIEAYQTAKCDPSNSFKPRTLSTLISLFCIRFTTEDWLNFLRSPSSFGYAPDNWLWAPKISTENNLNTNQTQHSQTLKLFDRQTTQVSDLSKNKYDLNNKHNMHQMTDDSNTSTDNNLLNKIHQKLNSLTQNQNQMKLKLNYFTKNNITSLDDMFYSDCRGLKAFGVDQYGKQIMQIISTAINNDKHEYKYKFLCDILNSNHNKQTQKLQGIFLFIFLFIYYCMIGASCCLLKHLDCHPFDLL
eukprot:13243_1